MRMFRYFGVGVLMFLALTVGARADSGPNDQQIMIDQARSTVQAFAAQPDMAEMRRLLGQSYGILIFPQILKAGFIIGGSGGSGVLVGHDPNTGAWTAPAFFTMGSGSFGLQIGAEASQVVLLVMNRKALSAIINNKVKLGADATVAVGPVGKGLGAGVTTAMNADIYTFARSKGLFGGISLSGSVVQGRDDWDQSYYGEPLNAAEIVLNRKVSAPAAAGLIQALGQAVIR